MSSKLNSGRGPNLRRQPRSGQAGFTLIEMVVAISLSALVLLILLLGLRLGASALQEGDRQLAGLDRSLTIVQVMGQQVAAAVPRLVQVKGEMGPVAQLCFRGNASEVSFLTRASLVPDPSYGLWLARYQVVETDDGRQQLEATQIPALDDDQLQAALLGSFTPLGPVEALGDPAERILLSYLRPAEGGKPADWVGEWGEKKDEKAVELPLGIRIQVWRNGYAGALTFEIPARTVPTP